ncbi:MAG TPA: EAL domain-containing protein [Acidobacteriaceae bacterium]
MDDVSSSRLAFVKGGQQHGLSLQSTPEGERAAFSLVAVETVPDGILVTDHRDPREPIVFANAAFLKMTGYRLEEVIGRNCRFLQGSDLEQPEREVLRIALSEGRSAEVLLRNYRKDGSPFWNRLLTSPVHDNAGEVTHFVGVQHDASSEINLLRVARSGRVELLRVFESTSDLLITVGRQGIIKRMNPAAAEVLGSGSALGSGFRSVLPQSMAELVGRMIDAPTRDNAVYTIRTQHGHASKKIIQWSVSAVEGRDILLIGLDISEQDMKRQFEVMTRRNQGILDSVTDAFLSLDRDWRYVYMNRRAEDLLCKSREELVGRSIWDVFPEAVDSNFYKEYQAAVATGEPRTFSEYYAPLDCWFEVRCFPHPEGLALLFQDATEERQAQAHLSYLATHDTLTGLPNRNSCLAHLQRFVDENSIDAPPTGEDSSFVGSLAVLFLDLDCFKEINDTAGHAAGDTVLAEVARRISSELPEGGFAGRISGDEFVLALERHNDVMAMRFAQRLIEIIGTPFIVGEQDVTIGASIGIAMFPQAGQQVDQLLRNSDAAMYAAKDAGRNAIRLFTDDMARAQADKLVVLHDMHDALRLGQFELFYQPKFDLNSGLLSGAEALIRWNHPNRGRLGPAAFIDIAERSQLIVEIGGWVLERTCAQVASWRTICPQGVPRIDVNLSARQLVDLRLPETVASTLLRHGLEADAIGLEITESMLTADMDVAARVLWKLQTMGVSVALDDFGTGYSNLSYIQRFPIGTLKIDQSFVQAIERTQLSRALVEAIVRMARALNLEVVAEGVETQAQLDFLVEQGCDAMQGYLVSAPVPADVFRTDFLFASTPINLFSRNRAIPLSAA